MSLTFGAAISDRVVMPSGVTLDPFTFWGWFYSTTLSTGRRLATKQATGFSLLHADTSGNLTFQVQRSGAGVNLVSSSLGLAINKWHFVACTYATVFAAATAAHIYIGTLGTTVAETTYSTPTTGSGIQVDSNLSYIIGNRSGADQAFRGRIACAGLVNAELNLGQLQDLQFYPRVIANTRYYFQFGYNGVGLQPDLSGNAMAGTVTGATQDAHVPTRAPFGRGRA